MQKAASALLFMGADSDHGWHVQHSETEGVERGAGGARYIVAHANVHTRGTHTQKGRRQQGTERECEGTHETRKGVKNGVIHTNTYVYALSLSATVRNSPSSLTMFELLLILFLLLVISLLRTSSVIYM